MSTLVQQLMIIAKSEQSSLKDRATVIPLDPLLEEIRRMLSSQEHRVTLRTDWRLFNLSGHADLIRSMVTNLVCNAIRASPPGEPVEIVLHATSDGTVLEVCDRGPGMNTAQKSRVFDSFHSSSGGTGLGLAIANAVIKAHERQISIHDRRPCGLCIEVFLPKPSDEERRSLHWQRSTNARR